MPICSHGALDMQNDATEDSLAKLRLTSDRNFVHEQTSDAETCTNSQSSGPAGDYWRRCAVPHSSLADWLPATVLIETHFYSPHNSACELTAAAAAEVGNVT